MSGVPVRVIGAVPTSRAQYMREYRLKNKDKVVASVRKYKAQNKEKIAAYRQLYQVANKGTHQLEPSYLPRL